MVNTLFLPLMVALAYGSTELTRVPGIGLVPTTCIVEVKNNVLVTIDQTRHLNSDRCKAAQSEGLAGVEQIYAQDTHAQNASLWKNFTANWVVPDLPEEAKGQVDYHWPGFKAEQPEMGYPVLQPVLQYGQSLPARWQVQSWFVHGGAVTAPAIEASPGDLITSFMSFDPDSETWTVSGTNTETQESSVLTITKERLGGYDFDWAMVVHETIMAASGYCAEYPASDGIAYTSLAFDGVETPAGDAGENTGRDLDEASPLWTYRVQKEDCSQAVDAQLGTVSLAWNHNETM